MTERADSRREPIENGIISQPAKDADQYLYDLVYGDFDFSSDAASRRILTQQEGLSTLNGFLLRKSNFDSLGVFTLNFDGQKNRRKSGQYQFYLGRLDEGTKNPYYLAITPGHYLGHEPEQLYVVPRVAQAGQTPYYWIEFTEEITEGAVQPAFLSYRLRPDQPSTKIDSKYWRGLEEQLLVDYILGENGIEFNNLLPVRINLGARWAPYCLGAIQNLALRLAGNPNVNLGDSLNLLTNTDEQGLYSWIEAYKINDEQKLTPVASWRIQRDEKRLISLGWRDPETQLFLDYLSGHPEVSFENLRPVRVKLPERFNQIPFGQGTSKYFSINIGNSTELGVDEVLLVPQQDHKGFYQWVEAYKFDPNTGLPVGKSIASARMIQGEGFERTGWMGAGRQSLIDYTEGTKTFEELLPITTVVGANVKMLDLWGVKKEHVYLTLSTKSSLKPGDEVTLIPEKEAKGIVTFRLVDNNSPVGIYDFDPSNKKFTAVETFDRREVTIQPKEYLLRYSVGNATFTELKPIKLRIGKSKTMIDILSRGDVHIYLTHIKSFNLQTGDDVELIPESEREGKLSFAFVKDGQTLGRYIYDSKVMKFHRVENRPYVEPVNTLTADTYLRDLVFGEGD